MTSSLLLVDFTQDLPAQGWSRMPQPQHVGQMLEPARAQSGQEEAERPKMRKGDAHFSLGGKVPMKPRRPAGPFSPDQSRA